jgi:hypothetical protein
MIVGLIALAVPLHAENLVGSTVPPYPAGLSEREGACIGDKPGLPCEWGLSVLVNAAGQKIQIVAGSDAKGQGMQARWLVTDAIPYPKLGKGMNFVMAMCRSGSAGDNSILAVVRDAKREFLPASGWAYRLDRTSGKFVKLDPKGIDCVNEGLDAD